MSGHPDGLDSELLFICCLILWLLKEFLKQVKSFWINSPSQHNRHLLSMLLVLLNLPDSTRSWENVYPEIGVKPR